MSSSKPTLGNRPPGEVVTETWNKLWDQNWTPFHRAAVNWALEKFYDVLREGQDTPLRVFVPLCGKTIDMKWLVEKKHEVVGVDISSLAIQSFFKENDISYSEQEIADGTLYKSTDPNLRVSLYCTSFFDVTKQILGGDFDIIQDRGSFAALSGVEKEKYCSVIKTLLSPRTRYLLNAINYDDTKAEGPPFSNTEEDVNKWFGDSCTIEKLEARDAVTDAHRKVGLTSFIETAYLLRMKP